MSSIEYLESLVVVGDAYHDRELWDLAHDIVMGDGFCMLDKLRALRKMDEATGEVGEVSEGAVEEYVRLFSD